MPRFDLKVTKLGCRKKVVVQSPYVASIGHCCTRGMTLPLVKTDSILHAWLRCQNVQTYSIFNLVFSDNFFAKVVKDRKPR